MSDVIRHSLDLVIDMIDATTGRHVGDTTTVFEFGDKSIPAPIPRGTGQFIIMGFGRENFHMQIKLKGYEVAKVYVDYEKLDQRLPLQSVFLIPTISSLFLNDVIQLRGNHPGISSLTLVRMVDVRAHADTYDAKKRILSVFERGNRLNMEGSPFGIIGSAQDRFEIIEIMNQKADDKVILKDPLMEEFFRNAPIARVICGDTDSDGNYLIAVRDDGADLRCILRYEIDGKTNFMKVDFHNLEEFKLYVEKDLADEESEITEELVTEQPSEGRLI